jgi:ABC-2 type transport system permease protein
MTSLRHEWRLLSRSRWAMASLAVVSGLREVERQRDTIARLIALQRQELAVQGPQLAAGGDAGSVAYDSFLATWDPPTPATFLALGLRDMTPHVLRVRALALQAQLHEGETFNPELALAGRFDAAFVLVYLLPLFLIALLHDLVSSERQSGRLATLMAPGWRRPPCCCRCSAAPGPAECLRWRWPASSWRCWRMPPGGRASPCWSRCAAAARWPTPRR